MLYEKVALLPQQFILNLQSSSFHSYLSEVHLNMSITHSVTFSNFFILVKVNSGSRSWDLRKGHVYRRFYSITLKKSFFFFLFRLRPNQCLNLWLKDANVWAKALRHRHMIVIAIFIRNYVRSSSSLLSFSFHYYVIISIKHSLIVEEFTMKN